jgi:16S rRNA (adenine1518-N6/adenine1519-N6)-dimethyltransferase
MARRPPLGQHFLHDEAVADRIVNALDPDGREVLEIGPGRGVLTGRIASRASRLTAVEIDRRLAFSLTRRWPADRVVVHRADVLARPLADWLEPAPVEGWLLVGNLPYAITSPVLFAVLDSVSPPDRAVLMVQKEVAERLAARPGSRTYGILSVLLAVQADVELLFRVGRGAFQPPPRVDSAVLRLTLLPRSRFGVGSDSGPSRRTLQIVVRTAFAQRRKMLRNSLGSLTDIDREELTAAGARSGIDLTRRPESLAQEEFVALARALEAKLDVSSEQEENGRHSGC